MTIKSKDIDIIVQGPIYDRTIDVVISIRNNFPQANIILSTWRNSLVPEEVDSKCDFVIYSEDPGDFTPSGYKPININRQIVSVKKGLEVAKRKFVLKTRTDIIFENDSIIRQYNKYNHVSNKSPISDRILISNFSTRDNELSVKVPYWFCDFIYLSNSENIKTIFNVDLFTVEDHSYFLNKVITCNRFYCRDVVSKFNPEIYLTLPIVKKYYPDCDNKFNDINSFDSEDQKKSVQLMREVFIILDKKRLKVHSFKNTLPYANDHVMVSFYKWKSLYLKVNHRFFKSHFFSTLSFLELLFKKFKFLVYYYEKK